MKKLILLSGILSILAMADASARVIVQPNIIIGAPVAVAPVYEPAPVIVYGNPYPYAPAYPYPYYYHDRHHYNWRYWHEHEHDRRDHWDHR